MSTKAHFQLQFWQFEHVTTLGQFFWQFHDNIASMAFANIYFAHQIIENNAYKHAFYTPKHITWHMQNFYIADQSLSSW